MPSDSGPEFPGWIVALFVIFILIAIGSAMWRISIARKMAKDAGLDPNTATALSVLTKDGPSATYLASTLAARRRESSTPAPQASKSVDGRLRELQHLRTRGLVSEAEFEAQRERILGSL